VIKNNRQSGSDRRRNGVDFDLQPTLKGNLIELRPLGPQDFDALFSAASDPKIWEQHPESDRYQREVFQRFFDGALESRGAFAIIERKSGRIVGSSRYCNLDLPNGEVEIGWTFLEREFWGGTYNRELKQLMLDHAFRFVDRVVFVVGENNIRSQKALAKIGASFLKKAQLPAADGTVRANVVFVITAKSYRASEPGARHQKAVLAETPEEII
jgi:RimJ/RimL family protein N-acetyltransferase